MSNEIEEFEEELEILDAEMVAANEVDGCPNPSVPDVDPIKPSTAAEDSLLVVPRYKSLMTASIGEDSLYERSKRTIWELSKDLNMTEKERMDIVAGQITQMTVGLSGSAMTTALTWAKEDALNGYGTALVKAQGSAQLAQAQLAMSQICKVNSEQELICAQIESTIASSIRENGKVAIYDPENLCRPSSLVNEGLKYEQTLQVNAATYSSLADAYRKSGLVLVGDDGRDGNRKGLSGDDYGHTVAQMDVAHRQIISFEDSKRNHAVNASSQTIGQIIAAEAALDPQIVENYNIAMEYLLTDSPKTLPGGSALLDPCEILFNQPGTDSVTFQPEPNEQSGTMTSQFFPNYITAQIEFLVDGNTRNGDTVVLRVDEGHYYVQYLISSTDIGVGHIICSVPSVRFISGGNSNRVYNITAYIQDYSGNKSANAQKDVTISYNQ